MGPSGCWGGVPRPGYHEEFDSAAGFKLKR